MKPKKDEIALLISGTEIVETIFSYTHIQGNWQENNNESTYSEYIRVYLPRMYHAKRKLYLIGLILIWESYNIS